MRFGKSRRFKWHPHDTAGYSSCADYSRRCCRSCGTNGAQRPKDSLPKIMDLVAQEQGYGMRRSDLPGSSRRAVSWFRCGQLRPLAAAKAGSLRCRDGCRKWLPQCWSWHIIVWLILIIIIMVWHVEPSPTITDLSICVVASPLQHMLLAVAAFRGVQTYEKIRADRPEPSSVRKEIYFLGCGWGMLRKWCGNCIKGYQRSSICLHFNHQKQVLHPWSQPHPGGGLAFTSSILQLLLPFEAVGSGWRNKTPYIAMMSRLGIGGNGLQYVHADASRGRNTRGPMQSALAEQWCPGEESSVLAKLQPITATLCNVVQYCANRKAVDICRLGTESGITQGQSWDRDTRLEKFSLVATLVHLHKAAESSKSDTFNLYTPLHRSSYSNRCNFLQ